MACGTEKILDNVIRVACLTTSGHVSADLRWLAEFVSACHCEADARREVG